MDERDVRELTVRLEILGPPRLLARGQEVQPPHRKSMALAGWLALHGGPVGRDQAVTVFWPSLDPSKGRRAMRTALSTFNKTAGYPVIRSSRDHLSLNPLVAADVQEFRDMAVSLEAEEPLSELYSRRLETAIALYRGPLLEGLDPSDVDPQFDDVITQENQSLRLVAASLLSKAVRSATLRGKLPAALEHARQWSRLDPLDEESYRRQMELLYWTGHKDLALQEFDRLADRLEHELGDVPDDETIELRDLILENRLAEPFDPGKGFAPASIWDGEGVRAGTTTVLSASLERAAQRLISYDAYDAASVVNLYLQDELVGILRRRLAKSTVVLGDRIGALFGFPAAGPDDSYAAVMAGLELVQAARGWNFGLTVGIGTGLVYRREELDDSQFHLACGPGVRQADIRRFGGAAGGVYLDDETAARVRHILPLESVSLAGADGKPVSAWGVKIPGSHQ